MVPFASRRRSTRRLALAAAIGACVGLFAGCQQNARLKG
jgi:hypothetical protein